MILWRDPGREEVDQKAVPFLVSWKEIDQKADTHIRRLIIRFVINY